MSTKLVELAQLVDTDCLLTDEASLQIYGKDWSNFYSPAPLAITFPKSTEQVQSIIKWANKYKVGIVPSGGRTGLSGGAVATNGELVVAMDKMNKIVDFEPASKRINCQAGVITARIQEFANHEGLFYPVDFASSGSSQIGGNVATNAGGIKVIRYGLTRDWILGLTVVTGSGEILKLNNGLIKNATGYDFRHLFIGSEGTLGIVTEVIVKLATPPKNLSVILLAIPDLSSLMPILANFQSVVELTAFEFFSDEALSKVIEMQQLNVPVSNRAPYYCLLEFDNHNDDIFEQVLAEFENSLEKDLISDGVISQSSQQAEELWKYREYISESISHSNPYKNDIAVTPDKVTDFLEKINKVVKNQYPEFEIIWFGHIGDGNLHLNILPPSNLALDTFKKQCDLVSPHIFEILNELSGTISAEHGVGLLKRDYLSYSRTEMEIKLMREIKKVFDPSNIMNPGKLL